MNLTKHAQVRAQQRNISDGTREIIECFGSERRRQGGVTEVCLTERDFKNALKKLERARNKALVFDADASVVITAYKRFK